ncbi:DUF6265 family protein [Christiangramia sabulilitoris]|uniref:DUF6265 domain-containing protein n=1 Tax=Christiangramia sabulilitoris TaxID=2583991 RepID=A0A550I8B5_9FLAO|nr:DUF6265 family protein [Christiangramia sabulilitoris]TRO67207.1 hypothetical protein FGM01_04805 [Christiangramia sabulilitoris]
MRIKLIIFLCLFLPAEYHFDKTAQDSKNFDWLIGNWIRTNNQPGLKTFEIWTKYSENVYHGEGFTLKDTDTVFKEGLQLVNTAGTWEYIVSGVNEEPTSFRLISIEKGKFIAENLRNEFPKRFNYYRDGEKLIALASADNKEVKFEFLKKDQK